MNTATNTASTADQLQEGASPYGEMTPPSVPGYEILELLGCGGMGAVFKARKQNLNRFEALKVIRAGSFAGVEQLARFTLEAETVARLHHPNVVQIYDYGEVDGRPYLSLEFVDGESLASRLKGNPLKGTVMPPREVAALLEPLALAAHHAHGKGIVHRDLKPANILLTADGTPKIADFGIARLLREEEGLTETGKILGTPSYMAPEQARDTQNVGPAADVYSLGAILYEMLTGRPPFVGVKALDVMNQACTREPIPPRRLQPSVPRDLETICLKCLQKEPDRRYASAADLAADLRRFLDGKPIRARRPSAAERLRKWARRHPGIAVLSVLLVAAVVGVVCLLVLESSARRRADGEAHMSRVQAARSALASWRWGEARALYGFAIGDDFPDRVVLEIERLRCLMADPTRKEFKAELTRVQARDDLDATSRATLLLYRGEDQLTASEAKVVQHGQELIRQALAINDGLSPADKAYAQGLLASPRKAIAYFQEALEHDRFHRAHHTLLLDLVFSGQFEAARRRAAVMLNLNPHDPVTHYALAVVGALEEDRATHERHLAALQKTLDPKGRAVVARHMAFLRELPAINRKMHQPGGDVLPRVNSGLAFLRALGQAAQHLPAALREGELPAVLGVPGPVLGRARSLLGILTAVQKELMARDFRAAVCLLEQAEREYPESLLRLQHAAALMGLAGEHMRRRDWKAVAREMERLRAIAREASTAPTLMPFGPYRHNARWLCVFVDASEMLMRRLEFSRAVTGRVGLAALPQGLPTLSTVGKLGGACLQFEAERVRRNRDDYLAVATQSKGYDEARTVLLPLIVSWLDPDDASLLLADWIHDEPKQVQPLRLRAQLELRLGNFGTALRDADTVLSRVPGDAEMKTVARAAREGLRRQRP